jgi:4-oxalomesaconate tautomerase
LHGGAVSTRTLIPHRVHEAIGVLGAVSVATACLLPGSVAADVAKAEASEGVVDIEVEHPTGFFTVTLDLDTSTQPVTVRSAALLRTARLLMRGEAFALTTRP